MIDQVATMRFRFSLIKHMALCQYGDDPYLDSLGVTSHLSSTFEAADKDKDAIAWMRTRPHKQLKYDRSLLFMVIELENIEDAIYFKMRWIIGDEKE